MGLASLIPRRELEKRVDDTITIADYLNQLVQLTFNGATQLVGARQGIATRIAEDGYRGNGPVFTCASIRALVFSDIELCWMERATRKISTNDALSLFWQPWPGGSLDELLARMELEGGTTAGNAYYVVEDMAFRNEQRLTRLDPKKVTILTGDVAEPLNGRSYGEYLVGYAFQESPGAKAVIFPQDAVIHYRPYPDPTHPFRGQSWVSAVLPDVQTDDQATLHKRSTFVNNAVPGLVFTFPPSVGQATIDAVADAIDSDDTHRGAYNSFKSLYLGGGVDVKTVGIDFKSLELKATQGAGETRIAAASGIGAVIAQFSEGMQGSALNAGNYGAARRRVADVTFRPLWRSAVNAMAKVVKPPPGIRLWYDDRFCSFLQEDVKDEADIRSSNAQTIRQLVDAGWDPDAAVAFVKEGDLAVLVGKHSGLFSVQLQAPGSGTAPAGRSAVERSDREEREAPMPSEHRTETHIHLPDSLQLEMRQEPVVVNVPPAEVVVNVAVPEQPAPVVNVEPQITVEAPAVTVEAPSVTVEAAPIPPAPDVQVTVETPRVRHRFKRDRDGNIVEATEEPM